MSVYTKKGDRGETSMYDPANSQMKRISKDSLRVWAIGSVDEVNSFLGVCATLTTDLKQKNKLERIQKDLFTIGSILAGAKLAFPISKVKFLEKEIDTMEGQLPTLKNFILPGGSPLAAHVQYVRTLTRRAERRIVSLNKIEPVKPTVMQYMNRLSDYFFVLSRFANQQIGIMDTPWQGKK
jgi:cob(I)alamin adenosyltransferase